jgi:hypothetical protein
MGGWGVTFELRPFSFDEAKLRSIVLIRCKESIGYGEHGAFEQY